MSSTTPRASQRTLDPPLTMRMRVALALPASLFVSAAVARVASLAGADPDRLVGFVPDDAFYYFRVAEHLLAGWWFSFDGVTLTNGFHPLWALLITPIFAAAGHTFVPVLVLQAALTGLGILVLTRLVARVWDAHTALAFAVLMSANPVLFTHAVNGLETGLLILTTSLLLWLAFGRPLATTADAVRLGVASAAVCLTRTDAIFLVVLSWSAVLATRRREVSALIPRFVVAGVVMTALLAPWLVFNRVVFGGYVQDSGRAFAALEHRYHEFHASLDVFASRPRAVWQAGFTEAGSRLGWVGNGVVAVVGLAGLWSAARRGVTAARAGLLAVLTGYGVAVLAAGATRLVIREWYLAPVIALPSLLAALTLGGLRLRPVAVGSTVVAAALLAFHGRALFIDGPWPLQVAEPAVVRALNERFQPGELVGNSDAGMWGWYGRFTTVNLDGLANSEVLPAIEQGRMLDYVRRRGIRTFFFGRDWWKRSWLMGPGSGLLYADEIISMPGRGRHGTEVRRQASRLLETPAEVVARFGRPTIAASDGEFARWLGNGWSIPHEAGPGEVWSSGSSSTLYLPLPRNGRFRVTLWLNAFDGPSRRAAVALSVNGRPVGRLVVLNAAAHRPYRFDVDEAGTPTTEVRLDYDRTWNPRGMGRSTDGRDLAVSIVRIDAEPLAAGARLR